MSPASKPQPAALELLAQHFSAKPEGGSTLVLRGQRIAVEFASFKATGAHAKPHLRFDRVATGLLERLRARFNELVPAGATVFVTITAPIRQDSKTRIAIEAETESLLAQPAPGAYEAEIQGNRVHIRVVKHKSAHAPRLIGFIHNPETDANWLFALTQEWLELVRKKGSGTAAAAGPRWLLILSPGEASSVAAHRAICAQSRLVSAYAKVIMLFAGNRLEVLTD